MTLSESNIMSVPKKLVPKANLKQARSVDEPKSEANPIAMKKCIHPECDQQIRKNGPSGCSQHSDLISAKGLKEREKVAKYKLANSILMWEQIDLKLKIGDLNIKLLLAKKGYQTVLQNPNIEIDQRPEITHNFNLEQLKTLGVTKLICLDCGKTLTVNEYVVSNRPTLATQCWSYCRSKKSGRNSKYYKAYRKRKRESDEKGFRRGNADNAKGWRYRKKEHMDEIYKLLRMNSEHRYGYYIDRAKRHDIPFDLTLEQCIELFKGRCCYCSDQADETHLNGIDRLNNDKGYEIDNCVVCCEMCNTMKGELGAITFILICNHILTNLGVIEGYDYPELLSSDYARQSGTYTTYKSNNETKNKKRKTPLPFELTIEQFNFITDQSCYLCGMKSNVLSHRNGVDRVDSKLGYTKANSLSCCMGCNYMKNSYPVDVFVNKLLDIHNHNAIYNVDPENLSKHPLYPLLGNGYSLDQLYQIGQLMCQGISEEHINSLLKDNMDLGGYIATLMTDRCYYLTNAKYNQCSWFQLPNYFEYGYREETYVSSCKVSPQEEIQWLSKLSKCEELMYHFRVDAKAIQKTIDAGIIDDLKLFRKPKGESTRKSKDPVKTEVPKPILKDTSLDLLDNIIKASLKKKSKGKLKSVGKSKDKLKYKSKAKHKDKHKGKSRNK